VTLPVHNTAELRLPQHSESDAALSAVNKPDEEFAAGRSDAAAETLPFPA
jgi:hypothetical protein